MPRLSVTAADGRRSSHDLDEATGGLSIGRSSSNDVVLADLALSRKHAELLPQGGGWVLHDCGSRNGTFVNGRRLEKSVTLEPGDRVTMGGCVLQFETEPTSTGRVVFSDAPLAGEGTVFLQLNDVMTMPGAEGKSPPGKPASAERDAARMRKFKVIERANMELLGHEEPEVLLPKILDLIFSAVEPDRAALFLDEDGELVCRAFRGGDEQMNISRTVAKAVMEQHVAVLTSDAQADARFREGASIMAQGIHAVMAVPLWNNKQVIGLIYADSRLASGLFDDDDLRVLTMLANIAAIQIENGRLFVERVERQRLDKEARAAAEIQGRLLPRQAPDLAGYTVQGMNLPCYEVGGDYYDYLDMGGGRVCVVLADVAGKGMGAAMLMAGLQATCHARMDLAPEPDTLAGDLNNAIGRIAPSNRFVTLCLLDLDTGSHRLRYVNAGHAPEPLLVRAGGGTEHLPTGGLPLGILPDRNYPVGELRLEPGDFIFLCSDGLTETVNAQEEEFGEERLERLLTGMAGRPPDEIRKAVDDALESHAGGEPPPDDLTMVILARMP